MPGRNEPGGGEINYPSILGRMGYRAQWAWRTEDSSGWPEEYRNRAGAGRDPGPNDNDQDTPSPQAVHNGLRVLDTPQSGWAE